MALIDLWVVLAIVIPIWLHMQSLENRIARLEQKTAPPKAETDEIVQVKPGIYRYRREVKP